jgi:PAS domain S-box-containing protein
VEHSKDPLERHNDLPGFTEVNHQRLRDRQLRAFFESALDAMLIADDEGRYVDVNPAACELFGLPREALLGQRIVDFAEPGFDFTTAWEAFQRDKRVKAEFRLVRPDGEVREVEFAATANFVPHRHLSVLRDVTERKQAEAALRLNEARYRAIVEDQTELICRTLPNGVLTFVNQAYCRYFNQPPEALIGQSFMALIPEDDRPCVQQHFASLSWDHPVVTYEHQVILPSGEMRWQQWVDRAIFTDTGELLEVQSVGRDITQQKETELALQQLNRELEQRVQQRTAELHQALDHLQFHVENSSLAIIGCDHDDCIQFWSPRAEYIFGWRADEVLGKQWKDLHLIHEDDLAEVMQVIDQLQHGKSHVIHTNRNYRKDGSIIYCEWHNSIQVDDAGNLLSILSLVHDVSDRKRAEEERNQAEAALQQREAILREAQRIAHVGSWEFDLDTRAIRWSEEMFHIFGLDPTQPEPTYEEFLQMLHPSDSGQLVHLIKRTIQEGLPYELEHRIIRPDGSIRYLVGRGEPILNPQGQVIRLFGAGIDITERRLVEEQLRQSKARLTAAQRVAHVGSWELDLDTRKITWSEEAFRIFGFDPNQPEPSYEEHLQRIHPDDQPLVRAAINSIAQTGMPFSLDFRILKPDGSIKYIEGRGEASFNPQNQPFQLFGTLLDITDRKHLEAELRSLAEREQLLRTITQHIHRSLNLNQILTTTVTEVRQVLQTDRVLIFRFKPDWSGVVVVESVTEPELSILETSIKDPCFTYRYILAYRHGRIQVTDDIYNNARLTPCHVDFLAGLQVRANLVVPILLGNEDHQATVNLRSPPVLWGLLIAHQCHAPRYWQSSEIDLMKQLATQAGIAIQQAEFHHQVQQFNADLERQVRARTAELELASEFESTLKRITDRVRDSLDENQILQSAVEELAKGLGVSCCNAALFDLEQGTSTICFEYTAKSVPPSHGRVSQMADFPEIYSQLLNGQHFQFCSLIPNPSRGQAAMLCCPIFDDQGVLGDLWLVNQSYYGFSNQDIRLVQQVANQCAIALRQSRLYQAAQAQVQELERLNQLKDDFLSTVSHELRTPMSNIKMATQMLEIALRETAGSGKGGQPLDSTVAGQRQEGKAGLPDKQGAKRDASQKVVSPLPALPTQNPKVAHYLSILKEECQREISLINDLLDLTRLDAGTDFSTLNPTNLAVWLPQVIDPFIERAHNQQQQLTVNIPDAFPTLMIDQSHLGRIVSELLNNACKYTPAGETITVTVKILEKKKGLKMKDKANPASAFIPHPLSFQLSVTNSGVEIPVHELPRIFDKFYRIPNNDPWKHGGTGLGLALVKKLAEQMGGNIQAESGNHKTCFMVEFPLDGTALSDA